MRQALAVGAFSFLVALGTGWPVILLLRRYRVGKRISSEGPERHLAKLGTPTMGGLIIFLTVVIATIPFNLVHRYSIFLPLGTMVGCGILGAFDDTMTLTGSKKAGMTARLKFAWLTAIALGAALVLYYGFEARSINVPFLGKYDIGLWYIPIAVFAIVGFANAVNLTDGLDTLAGGTAALGFTAYGVIAFLQQQAFLVTFSFTVVGATLGFLWYNSHPAMVFMGDTGSLALGATLAVVALMTGWWLLLPLIGGVFVIETGSVMAQVAYFKLTHGKRLLRMSPLHHHFELIGWKETQITMRFWLAGMAMAMLGIALALS
ncbi:MAG: phospho-N-acetylmuramoyl-pentapeptide-transferase [Chloroflexi bacterium]|nr:phospho-N-acetylmuramoyl-pentapeptide-transferase [Chloroflexota bacterium]